LKATTTHERRLAVARLARLKGTVLVADLAQEFGVSAMTIRTDLDALAGEGVLVRIRGGAAALRAPEAPAARARSREPLADAESLAVAREAAALVDDDDVIALDGGDLCHHVAGLLAARRNLTVLAGAVDTAQLLAANPSNTVILAGSLVRADGRGVQLHPAERPLHGLRVRKALLGCGACDSGGELYDTDPYTAQLKAAMAAAAEGVLLLLSGSEPERRAGVPFARLMDVSHVLSGRPLPPELRRRLPAGALVTVCGFQVATRDPARSAPRRFRIGFANMNDQHPFCLEVRHGLERAAMEAGNVELVLTDNRESEAAALANADALIRTGVDLVIEYQIDEAAGNVLMDRFRAAGIPVIAVDVPLPGAVFFGVDNYRAGTLAGEALGRAILQRWRGQVDAVLALELPQAGPVPRARLQGQLDGLRRMVPVAPERMRLLDAGNGEATAGQALAGILPELPGDARLALVGMNDETILGALAALRAAGRVEYALAVAQGLDRRAREELRRPDTPLIGGVTFHPESYGAQLIPQALDLLQGRPVPPAVYLTHEFIERHDLDTIGMVAAAPPPSAGSVAAAPPVPALRTAAPATSPVGGDARGAR